VVSKSYLKTSFLILLLLSASIDVIFGLLFGTLYYRLYKLKANNHSPIKKVITASILAVSIVLYYSIFTEIAEFIINSTSDNHQTSSFQLININVISNVADFVIALSFLFLIIKL